MPKDLNAGFIQEKNKEIKKYVRLYTIFDYKGTGEDLRYAEYDQNIVFDGLTYTAAPIKFQNITETSAGEASELIIGVSNIDRTIEAYLRAYDLRQRKVTITYVFIDRLSETDVKYVETFYIKKYQVNRQVANFTLSGRDDVFKVLLPGGVVSDKICTWKRFKGVECAYAGAETSCNRTLQRCRELNNVERFGGEPSAGGKRMFV